MVSDTTLPSRRGHFDRFRFAALVTALDDRLRLRLGVIEYTQSQDCLFRIQPAASLSDLTLSDGTHIRIGDPIVHLHVWNEQFPPFPSTGPTVGWARRVNRAFERSLSELSYFLKTHRDFDGVVAICGDLTFEPHWRATQLTQFVARFGFEPIAAPECRSLSQRAHWLGQNIFISMVVLAHNAAALRVDSLWRDRIPVFLSRKALDARYGIDQERYPKRAGLRAEESDEQQPKT
jgi:YkoP domain